MKIIIKLLCLCAILLTACTDKKAANNIEDSATTASQAEIQKIENLTNELDQSVSEIDSISQELDAILEDLDK